MDNGMIIAISLKALAVLVLVLLNGFFVAAEFALVKIRDTQLTTLIAKGNRAARIARRIIRNLDVSLSACQLGITLASLALGWIGEPIFSDLLQPLWKPLGLDDDPQIQHTISFIVGFSVITFLHITAGEQAPKWLAIQKPLPTALWIARPLEWFRVVSYPFIWVLNHASLWLLRRLGLELGSEHDAHTDEELRLLFTTSQQRGGGTQLGHDIVLNAFDLRYRVAREVMRPRQEIVSLDVSVPIAECLDVAEKSRYSRLLLCDGDLDHTLGVVHIKDLFAKRHVAQTAADLAPVARKIIFVPETTRLEKLLQLFLERKLHFALVVDEFGGTVGLVTLENVLEELVGQIQDEFDQEKQLLIRTSERSWDLDGALPLHELSELVGEALQQEGITTVSGWVTYRRGGFPKAGDVLPCGAHQLQVEEMDGMRVSRLKLTRAELPDAFETGKEKRPS